MKQKLNNASDIPHSLPKSPTKLLDQVRELIRSQNKAYETEKIYIYWIRRFILFHNKTHPSNMGEPEIEQFVTWLASQKIYRQAHSQLH